MKNKKETKRIGLECDVTLYKQIKGLADKESRTISSMVRLLLSEAVKEKECKNDEI